MTTIISTSTESHKKERENTKDDNVHKQRKCLKLELKYISYGKLRIERKKGNKNYGRINGKDQLFIGNN